jgi:hypothetical protein
MEEISCAQIADENLQTEIGPTAISSEDMMWVHWLSL